MLDQFELASGSVTGKLHRRLGRNNQDAMLTYQDKLLTIAIVADGCGSQPHSEVGAQLGVRLAAQTLRLAYIEDRWADYDTYDLGSTDFYTGLAGNINEALDGLVAELDQPDGLVYDCLLFTLIGCLITPEQACFFGYGDGVIGLNGQLWHIGAGDNTPDYLAYGLLAQAPATTATAWLTLPTKLVNSFIVATDGLSDLVAAAEKPLAGRSEPVGVIDQLWRDDRFYRNPDKLRRYLTQVNGGINPGGQGYLGDDTTIVVGRRKEGHA